MKKLYIGAMGISNKAFQKPYEDPDSPQFKDLASLVSQQVRGEGTPLPTQESEDLAHSRCCPSS